jgi:hypothetical protein
MFPVRFHRLLDHAEREGLQDIVSWMPDGMSFKIHNKEKFAAVFLKRYFRHSQFKSFLRQLSMYKFRRISTTGAKRGAYFHPLFLKNMSGMCHHINRTDQYGSFLSPVLSSQNISQNITLSPSLSSIKNEGNYLMRRFHFDKDLIEGIIHIFGSNTPP